MWVLPQLLLRTNIKKKEKRNKKKKDFLKKK